MGTPTTNETTEYVYFMSNGHSYENPEKKDFQYFEDTYGDTTEQEIIDRCNSYNGLAYFIGTQAEYDTLNNLNYYYFKKNEIAGQTSYIWEFYLVNGKKGAVPTFGDLAPKGAIEITEAEYNALLIENQKGYDKEALSQNNIYLSTVKVSEDQMKGAIAEQQGKYNLAAMRQLDSTLRTTLANWGKDGSFVPGEIMKLGLNVTYYNRIEDLGTYSDALVTTEEARRRTMYDNVINNDMSILDAFKTALKEHLPVNIVNRNGKDVDTVQSGKELHEKYVVDLLGQPDYDTYLSETAGLNLSTHLDPYTETK